MNELQKVVPMLSTGGHFTAQTSSTGSTWVKLTSVLCKQVTVSNQTGTTLEFRQSGTGAGFAVPTGTFYTFFGLNNADSLEVRRVDVSNTQVTASFRWEA